MKVIDCSGMDAATLHDHETKIQYVKMRLQITKVYLMSLFLNISSSKYSATDRSDATHAENVVEK